MANKTIQKIVLVAASLALSTGIFAMPETAIASPNSPIVSCEINYANGQKNADLSNIRRVENATVVNINNGASAVRNKYNAQNRSTRAMIDAAQQVSWRFGGKLSNIVNIVSDIARTGSNIQGQQNNRTIDNTRSNMDNQVRTVLDNLQSNVRQIRDNELNALRYVRRSSNPRSIVVRITKSADGEVRTVEVRAQNTLARDGIRLAGSLQTQNVASNFCPSL